LIQRDPCGDMKGQDAGSKTDPEHPLRIVHVITRLINGGADENTVHSCNWAAQKGHDVALLHAAAPAEGGDPVLLGAGGFQVSMERHSLDERAAFELLRSTVRDLMEELGGDPPLSGLKDQLRKREPGFSEKDFGYSGFLQFCKAAVAKNVVEMDWEEEDGEYYLYVEDAKTPA
jgi:hypothetical protein